MMEDDRWAKRILQDIIISGISTPWLRDIAPICKLLEIPEDVQEEPYWKKKLEKACKEWEIQELGKAKDTGFSLKYYPNRCGDQKAWNVVGTEWGMCVTWLKLGDLGKRTKDGRVCLLCDKTCDDVILHMFSKCDAEKKGESCINDTTGAQVKSQQDIQLFISQINRKERNVLMNKMRKWHYDGKTNSK